MERSVDSGPRAQLPLRLNLSADAKVFIPPSVQNMFDDPLPTFVFPPGEELDYAKEKGVWLQMTSPVATCSAFPLLSQQLPMNSMLWPSLNDGLSNSQHLIDAVISATTSPVTSLSPSQYAEHAIALLAAEVASSRAEISKYDLQVR